MKILFDCNVIVDVWGSAEDFFFSYSSLDTTLTRKFELCITPTILINSTYVLSARKYTNKKEARRVVGALLDIFDVIDCTPSDCVRAHESEMEDYEDALIAYSAQRCGVDFIITRNKKDFANSPVPALTPEEFLAIYKPEYLEYEIVDISPQNHPREKENS